MFRAINELRVYWNDELNKPDVKFTEYTMSNYPVTQSFREQLEDVGYQLPEYTPLIEVCVEWGIQRYKVVICKLNNDSKPAITVREEDDGSRIQNYVFWGFRIDSWGYVNFGIISLPPIITNLIKPYVEQYTR